MPRQMSQQQQGQVLAPRPPLAAYREDLSRRGAREPFGPSDATWISVATILSHAVDVPIESRSPLLPMLREIVDGDPTLRDVLPAEAQSSGEFELDGVSPIVRVIVARMEDAGALNLAYSTLTILADADLRLSAIERGRVLAHLGRVAWKAGALETAREHYRRTEVLGRTAGSSELRVRAWIGYSIVARLRGNYPEVRKWGARAAHEADRVGLAALGSLAYHSLMVSAAVGRDLNGALVYGWRAYQNAIGDASKEAEALLNLSQFLLECEQPEAALRGFAATLDRSPSARLALPALGGMALAAAALGQGQVVQATRARTERVIETVVLPYEHAGALLELSEALRTIGDVTAAASCRERALAIAERHSYHEIVHRLSGPWAVQDRLPAEAPLVLNPAGTQVARAVASLQLAGHAGRAG
jgi:tetratricopeptide (TPR) repeat protein